MAEGKALMIQGTSSHCGKTTIVAALCKIFVDLGYRVAPFKAQNMSLNSYVTYDGGEIARAQALQALAAGVEPERDMNPILLKPMGERRSQLVLHGKPIMNVDYKEYMRGDVRRKCLEAVRGSLARLLKKYELVLIEGAGSPAEINLYGRDIANMLVAEMASAPVLLIGDIERGGVFASLYGTVKLLQPRHRSMVKGLIINKFRGDPDILRPGIAKLERLLGKRVLGVIPYVEGLSLPSEDSVSLGLRQDSLRWVDIAVVRLPHISNFTDFEALELYPWVGVRYVSMPKALGKPDLIVLPGTKNTVSDLLWLKMSGLDDEILGLKERGVPVLGICGGFQMLGLRIRDPLGIEGGRAMDLEGLGLLDVETTFQEFSKVTTRVDAAVIGKGPLLERARGCVIRGYEVHMGKSRLGPEAMPAFRIFRSNGAPDDRLDGAVSKDGLCVGTYLHGLFDSPSLRTSILMCLLASKGRGPLGLREMDVEDIWLKSVERLAEAVSKSLDIADITSLVGLRGA